MLSWLRELLLITATAIVAVRFPYLNALAGFLLIFLAPGWQTLRWLGISPRRSTSSLLLAVGLSLAVSPVILYWTGLLAGFRSPLIAFALAGVSIAMGVLARLRPAATGPPLGALFQDWRHRRIFAGLLVLLGLIILIPLVQVRTQAGLIPPGMSDWAKHQTISWLIETTGLPPRHLFYPPWQQQNFVYYYFFHILVAALRLMSGGSLSILAAFTVTTLAVCLDFVGLVALVARRLTGQERPALISALFVSLIGGLDLLPLLPKGALAVLSSGLSLRTLATLRLGTDCFAGSIPSPYAAYLWAPHHIGAGVALLAGLAVWQTVGGSRRLALLAPVLLFAVAGYSVYFAIPVFVALALYGLLESAAGRADKTAMRRLLSWAAVAAATVLLALPYLRDLLTTVAAETSGIVLYVSSNGSTWTDGAFFASFLRDSWLTRLLDAPLHWVIDVGGLLVFGVVGWIVFWRNLEPGRGEWTTERRVALLLLFIGGASLIVTTFFTSRGAVAQLSCNDLRMRGSLPLQIGLAVFAGLGVVWLWDRANRLVRVGVMAVIVLGVASTVWTFTERGLVRFVQPPAVTNEALAAYEFVRGHTPAEAIFQGDVGREVHQDRLLHLYADRVSRVESGSYPLLQVPADTFRPDVQNTVAAFRTRDGAEAWRLWDALGVDYIFIGPQERQAYGPDLPQFDDNRYFEVVYDHFPYQIMRVR